MTASGPPVETNKTGLWLKRVLWLSVLCAVAGLAWWGGRLSGRQSASSQEHAADLAAARHAIRTGDAQTVLDRLINVDTAEAHYLRALAFERQELVDAAKSSITKAIDTDPENLTYQGLKLRIGLYGGNIDVADALIKLVRQNPPSAALAYFAAYAHTAKCVHFFTHEKQQEFLDEEKLAIKSLKISLALREQIPELHGELLDFSMRYQLNEQALQLVGELLTDAPENLTIQNEKLKLLLRLERIDEAIALAESIYDKTDSDLDAARTFVNLVSRSERTPENDRRLDRVLEQFPDDIPIFSKYAVYRARGGNTEEACQFVNDRVKTVQGQEDRFALIAVAIAIPLEANNARIAAEQLARYRNEIVDPTLVNYYEGRVLFLQGQHNQAMAKMLEIVNIARATPGSPQPLAEEALVWWKKIREDLATQQQLDRTLNAIGQDERDRARKESRANDREQ